MATGYVFAILTGFFFGLQGVWGKVVGQKLSPILTAWGMFTFSLPILVLLLAVEGFPVVNWRDFLWATSVSLGINLLAWNFFFRALHASPLAHTMPFTAFTPLFIIPVGFLWLGELPDAMGVVGIFLIIAGGYGIHLNSGSLLEPFRRLYNNQGTRLMLLVAAMWSISATAEKVAVLSSSRSFYALVISTLLASAYTIFLQLRGELNGKQIQLNLRSILILGVVSGLMIIFQFTALKTIQVSYVIAFKRTGIVVSVLIGAIFFREKHPVKHLFFSALMVAGAFLLLR